MDTITCKVCKKTLLTISEHVDHFILMHQVSHSSTFSCGFGHCPVKLKCLSSYKVHVKDFHTLETNTSSEESLYKCPVQGCNEKRRSQTSLRAHKFWKHGSEKNPPLLEPPPSSSLVSNNDFALPSSDANCTQNESANYLSVDHDLNQSSDVNEGQDSSTLATTPSCTEEMLRAKVSHLSLSLNTKYHVPDSTIGHIIHSYSHLLKESSKITSRKLVERLSFLNDPTVEAACESILSEDPLLKLHGPEGPFRSSYCRKKEYASQFSNMVKPVQISLGLNEANKPCKYHYIPVKQSLQAFFKDDSVYQQYVENRHRRSVLVSDDLTDIHSGSVFTENKLLWEDCNSIQIILFQDEVDLTKAIGAAAGTHKMLHVGFTLGNLHPWHRSKSDPLQVALLCNEKDVEYFGLVKILEPLIDDLIDLEINGVEIRGEVMKATILVLLGDNLGTHMIGGFVENFSSSKYFCRYCEESRADWRARWNNTAECSDSEDCSESDEEEESEEENQMTEEEVDCPSDDDTPLADLIPLSEIRRKLCRPLRTVESYKNCVKKLESSPNSSVKGVVADSELNRLKYFHIIGGSPPCLPHDIFIGFAPYDIQLSLKRLCNQNKFKIEYVNRRIKTFHWNVDDGSDKPPAKFDDKRKKVKGNAAQIWSLIRFLPLLIADKIQNKNDPAWVLILLLNKITRLLTSPVISKESVKYIEELINKYLTLRSKTFSEPLRPKHHFFEHYPVLLLRFGSLMKCSTLRFEQKHKFFRSEFVNKKCLKNPTYSLSLAHQGMQATLFADSIFENKPVMNDAIPLSALQLEQAAMDCLIATFGNLVASKLLFSTKVTFHNYHYQNDKVLVVSTKNHPTIDCLKMLLLMTDGKSAYVLGRKCQAVLKESQQVYILGTVQEFSVLNLECLKDYVAYPIYRLWTQHAIVLKFLYL